MRKLKIVVESDLDTGETSVSGPLDQRLAMCNILATAIQVIVTRQPNGQPRKIVAAPASAIPNGGNAH